MSEMEKVLALFKNYYGVIVGFVGVMYWFDQRYITPVEKIAEKMEAYHLEAIESKGNLMRIEYDLQALREEVRTKQKEKEKAPVDGTSHTNVLFVPPVKDEDKDKQTCYISAR